EIVVQITSGFYYTSGALEHRGGQILRRCLSHASGYRNDLALPRLDNRTGERLKRRERIVDHQQSKLLRVDRARGFRVDKIARYDCRDRAPGHRIRDEVMSIVILAANSEEQLAGPDRA